MTGSNVFFVFFFFVSLASAQSSLAQRDFDLGAERDTVKGLAYSLKTEASALYTLAEKMASNQDQAEQLALSTLHLAVVDWDQFYWESENSGLPWQELQNRFQKPSQSYREAQLKFSSLQIYQSQSERFSSMDSFYSDLNTLMGGVVSSPVTPPTQTPGNGVNPPTTLRPRLVPPPILNHQPRPYVDPYPRTYTPATPPVYYRPTLPPPPPTSPPPYYSPQPRPHSYPYPRSPMGPDPHCEDSRYRLRRI